MAGKYDDDRREYNMPDEPFRLSPLGIAGIGAGVQAVGQLGASLTQNNYYQNLIKEQLDNFRRDRYVPDYEPFRQSIQLQIQDILSQVPGSVEAINADFARRGLYSGSAAPAAVVKYAIDPLVRSALTAGVQGELGYQQLRSQGLQAADQYFAQLVGAGAATQGPSTGQAIFGALAQGGETAAQYGLLKELGFFD